MNKRSDGNRQSSHPSARSTVEEDLDRAIKIVTAAGRQLESRGERVGTYFAKIDKSAAATQRYTRENLATRLRQAEHLPQIITVRSRGSRPGAAYLILPLEKAAELLEVRTREDSFEPITVLLRRIGGDIEIPAIAPRKSDWPGRQTPCQLVEPGEDE